MKNVLLFFYCITVCFSLQAQSLWTQTGGPGQEFTCLTKVNGLLWAGASDGVYISKNQGQTWSKTPYIDRHYCHDIFTTGIDTAVIVYQEYSQPSSGSTLLGGAARTIATFDGGATWSTPVLMDANPSYPSLRITRTQNSLIYTNSNNVAYKISFDFGRTWSALNVPNPLYQYYLEVSSSLSILESLQARDYYLSTNGGHSYTLLYSFTLPSTGSIHLHDSIILGDKNFYYSFQKNQIMRSADHGVTWDTTLRCAHDTTLGGISSRSDTAVVQAHDTFGHVFYYCSTDFGRTWALSAITPLGTYYSSHFAVDSGDDLQFHSPWICRVRQDSIVAPSMTGSRSVAITTLMSDKNNLYASSNLAFYRSADAGRSWQVVNDGVPGLWKKDYHIEIGVVHDMLHIGDTLFIAGSGAMAWTYDNGLHWSRRDNSHNAGSRSYMAQSGSRIFYSARAMVYSDDYGHTWDTVTLPMNSYTPIGTFDHEAYVCLGSNLCKYNRATNIWDSIYTIHFTIGVNTFAQFDSVYLLLGHQGFGRSFDHGRSWSFMAWNTPGYVALESVISTPMGWIGVGDSSKLYRSIDSGSTWQFFLGAPNFNSNGSYSSIATLHGSLYLASYSSGVWQRGLSAVYAISGTVYDDQNNNGIRDAGERGIAGIVVGTSPSGSVAATDSGGHYTLYSDGVGEVLRPSLPQTYMSASPASTTTTGAAMGHADFGVYTSHNVRDLAVDVVSGGFLWNAPSGTIDLYASNKGYIPQPATVRLTLDSPMHYLSATPPPVYVSSGSDTVVWQLDTLHYQDISHIAVSAYAPGFIDDPLSYQALITPIAHDTFPLDNYYYYPDFIVASLDPNTKECAQGTWINPQAIHDSSGLTYTIRFENIGNATATNVVITDTLSPLLDFSTMRIVSSSYPVTLGLSGQGAVSFTFSGIHLPPHSQDSIACHGFVKYSVRCNPALQTGDAISNTAFIYFDSNPAIVTNEVVTVVSPSAPYSRDTAVAVIEGISEVGDPSLHVYPNPATGYLNIDLGSSGNDGYQIDVFDQLGREVRRQSVQNDHARLDVRNLADGVYIGRVLKTGYTFGTFRFVVSH